MEIEISDSVIVDKLLDRIEELEKVVERLENDICFLEEKMEEMVDREMVYNH